MNWRLLAYKINDIPYWKELIQNGEAVFGLTYTI